MVWLYNYSHCLFFIRILTCGYKCGYNYFPPILNNIDISLLGVKFESAFAPGAYKWTSTEVFFMPEIQKLSTFLG
ncbi:hypothetical protein SEEI0720_021380 [Salmonella enterica subsp. enterica serovar Inverness str. ATCC 10720]|nr:hypothetical protein SEEI0720_021380 [Salmonella enterica subsp. enterica serovar Inverness str. ATCC 10720]